MSQFRERVLDIVLPVLAEMLGPQESHRDPTMPTAKAGWSFPQESIDDEPIIWPVVKKSATIEVSKRSAGKLISLPGVRGKMGSSWPSPFLLSLIYNYIDNLFELNGLRSGRGEKGDRGEEGIAGSAGSAGSIGPPGPRGLRGPKGDRGDDGVGIASCIQLNDTTVRLVFSDSTFFDITLAQGPPGENAPAYYEYYYNCP